MGIRDLISKIKGEEESRFPDDGTLDKSLHSLRKAKQQIDERNEKIALKEMIRNDRKEQLRLHLFGIKGERAKQSVNLLDNLDMSIKENVLQQKTLIQDNKNFMKNNSNKNSNNILKQPNLIKGGKINILKNGKKYI